MWPFWLITFAFILILIVSQLIQDGAFMDGVLYVTVSKNLADGLGTFWEPHLSKVDIPFHDQPPLYFGLLAVFYKLLGTSMYVERLFCFSCFSLTALYIHKLWKKIFIQNINIADLSWLPVFFWVTIPICFWAYINFVEETVMTLFVLISVYYAYIGLFLKKNTVYNLILAGIFIFLASLTKGFQGLFPIIAAGAYFLAAKNISFWKMLLYTAILVGVPVLIYTFLVVADYSIFVSFQQYFDKRLVATFNGVHTTTDERSFLLVRLFFHLLPSLSIGLITWLIAKKHNKTSIEKINDRSVIVWLVLIGLSGTLPLMITLEQRTWYLVTSLPFFAIAISMFIASNIQSWIGKIKMDSKGFTLFKKVSWSLFFASIIFVFSQVGNTKRDKEMLSDVYIFGKIIPYGSVVSVPPPMCFDFSFKEYMIRYFYISCDIKNSNHNYLITRKNFSKELIPIEYKRYAIKTSEFDLYILDSIGN